MPRAISCTVFWSESVLRALRFSLLINLGLGYGSIGLNRWRGGGRLLFNIVPPPPRVFFFLNQEHPLTHTKLLEVWVASVHLGGCKRGGRYIPWGGEGKGECTWGSFRVFNQDFPTMSLDSQASNRKSERHEAFHNGLETSLETTIYQKKIMQWQCWNLLSV